MASIPLYTVDDLAHFPEDGCRYEILNGLLLVTPQASNPHQIVATRIAHFLMCALGDSASVACSGAIVHGRRTELQPDVYVSAPVPLGTEWKNIKNHWLAVEVYSRSSRIYDREFKTPEYLRLGVDQVWLVDMRARAIEVFARGAAPRIERRRVEWTPPGLVTPVRIEFAELFK